MGFMRFASQNNQWAQSDPWKYDLWGCFVHGGVARAHQHTVRVCVSVRACVYMN